MIQDSVVASDDGFAKRYLESAELVESFRGLGINESKSLEDFKAAAADKAVVLYDDVNEGVVHNAYEDLLDPERHALILDTLVKDLFKANHLGKPVQPVVSVREVDRNVGDVAHNSGSSVIGRNFDDGRYKIYEFDYTQAFRSDIAKLCGSKTPLRKTLAHTPLSFAGFGNLMIRCGHSLDCDLFLLSPVSKVIGNKLFEISNTTPANSETKLSTIIEQLEAKVEFPDLRKYVNGGKIDLVKVLEIRKKAARFRTWLQSEADRDKDAIIAYHHEVAKQTGFNKIAKSTLNTFGIIAPLAASIAVEAFFATSDTVTKETTKHLAKKGIEEGVKKLSAK